jgi:hypothetical protein
VAAGYIPTVITVMRTGIRFAQRGEQGNKKDEIIETLKTIFDPDISVNVYITLI